jgi:nicotinate-nucleotide pyrophosphorylase (carboxylating)
MASSAQQILPMDDINLLPLDALYAHLSASGGRGLGGGAGGAGGLVRRLLELARDEDLGTGTAAGDITSLVCIRDDARATAHFVSRERGLAAGLAVLPEVLQVFRADVSLKVHIADGRPIEPGMRLATLHGSERDILAVERTSLNLLSRLCGVATLTARYLAAAGPGANLYDTRKTTPGMRVLEKYAVRCGGGRCHRMGVHDAVLIKDNHIAGVRTSELPGVVAAAAQSARALRTDLLFIEVEVDSLEQFEALCTLPSGTIDIVLLDNMTPEQLARAVEMRSRLAPWLQLEASGGVRLETVRSIAESGVDRISVGALTHSAVAVDIGLDFEPPGAAA